MTQEVLYNIWKEGELQERQTRLAGKIALTDIERPFVNVDANTDSFAQKFNDRLTEIYRYIIIGYNNGGNWAGLLTLAKRRLDFLLTDYFNRLVESRAHTADEIIDLGEKWIDTTADIIDSIIEQQKEDVYKKGAFKKTINPTTVTHRIEALDGVRDELLKQMAHTQRMFLKDLADANFAEIGPDAEPKPAPAPKSDKNGRGKPRKAFSSFVVDQSKTDAVITELKTLIGDKKGSDAYIILAAAVRAGLITRPAYNAVIETFGNLGASSGYNAKMAERGFTSAELKPIIEQLKNLA